MKSLVATQMQFNKVFQAQIIAFHAFKFKFVQDNCKHDKKINTEQN